MLKPCPVAGKAKSVEICEAFIAGAPRDATGSVFFGVDQSNLREWRTALEGAKDYFYCDNAFFDQSRGRHFRVAKNRVQHHGYGRGSEQRLAALGITIKPWREAGVHVVVCPQSQAFMGNVVGYKGDWLADVRLLLGTWPLRIRPWSSDKPKVGRTLVDDLQGAHALLTWSSSAAITAIIEGVPAVCMGLSAAMPVTGRWIEEIRDPPMPTSREQWLAVLANNEWALDEMRSGLAWRTLNA